MGQEVLCNCGLGWIELVQEALRGEDVCWILKDSRAEMSEESRAMQVRGPMVLEVKHFLLTHIYN